MSLDMHFLALVLCTPIAVILHGCGQEVDMVPVTTSTPTETLRRVATLTTTEIPLNPMRPETTAPLPNPGCSKDRENCMHTACCYNPRHRCYVKDGFFATCMYNCTPGRSSHLDPKGYRTPWSCAIYHPMATKFPKPTQAPKPNCMGVNKGCMNTGCCDGLTCYEKNKNWWQCKKSCRRGLDPADPVRVRTPWSCRIRTDAVTRTSTTTTLPTQAPELLITDDSLVTVIPPSTSSTRPPPSYSYCSKQSSEEGRLSVAGLKGMVWAKGGGGVVYGDSLELHHNSGYSLMTTCREKIDPEEFVELRLLGRTITFRVDLSMVGCACNLAFYLVSSPALDPIGMPSEGECSSSPYYCDANKVCGQWCPEIDLMEANTFAFQATPHKCDEPSSAGHYSNCDRNGCGQNTRNMKGAYGPGPTFRIDTSRPFDVETTFPVAGDTLIGMVTILRQGKKELRLDHSYCDPDYLAKISSAMAMGMTLRITYWGGAAKTMGWLDSPPCGTGEVCKGHNAGPGIISNVSVSGPELNPHRKIPGWISQPWPAPPTSENPNTWELAPLDTAATTTTALAAPEKEKAPFAFHVWGLVGVGAAIAAAYSALVVMLWRFPGLGPRLENEQVCDWVSLMASPDTPENREDPEQAAGAGITRSQGQGLSRAVTATNTMLRTLVKKSTRWCWPGSRNLATSGTSQ